MSPLKKNGALEYDSKAKTEILVSQFRSVFTKSISKLPFISQNYPNIDELTVTSDGVCKLLQDININKAMGPDLIPNKILKSCAYELSFGLATIFNKSLETGYLTNDWRDAIVTPIYKKGDKHSSENYRPVSCKLLEHIICRHMLKHFSIIF